MATLDEVKELASSEQGLCVVATTRADGTVHSSVVNAGPLDHPVSGVETIAFVARGAARKVALVAAAGRVSVTYRRGWAWAGVEGPAEIIDSSTPDVDLPTLLRNVFAAAGGTHDDWDTFDQVMVDENRVAVLVRPERIIGNR